MFNNIEAYYRLWFDTNRAYEGWAKSHGLTINSLFMLYEIKKTGGCTQKHLCTALFLPKQTVSGIVKQLIKNGHGEQTIAKRDGREKIVTLTSEGQIMASNILNELLSKEIEAFGLLGDKNATTLVTLWEKLLVNVKNSFGRKN